MTVNTPHSLTLEAVASFNVLPTDDAPADAYAGALALVPRLRVNPFNVVVITLFARGEWLENLRKRCAGTPEVCLWGIADGVAAALGHLKRRAKVSFAFIPRETDERSISVEFVNKPSGHEWRVPTPEA